MRLSAKKSNIISAPKSRWFWPIHVLFMIALFTGCARTPDINGTYKKSYGDYRYDTIEIQKVENDKGEELFQITTMQDGKKMLSTKSPLQNKKILQLWLIGPIEFSEDYKSFTLFWGRGSRYHKVQ